MDRFDSPVVPIGSMVVLAGAFVVIAGAFLPWITASLFGSQGSLNGFGLYAESSPIFNGLVTLVLALVATAFSLAVPDQDGFAVLAAVLGGLVVLIGGTFVVAPHTALGGGLVGRLGASVSETGIGVYATVLGGLVIVAGSAVNFLD